MHFNIYFLKNEYFLGFDEVVDIFFWGGEGGGITKLDYFLGGGSLILYMISGFFLRGVAEFKIF